DAARPRTAVAARRRRSRRDRVDHGARRRQEDAMTATVESTTELPRGADPAGIATALAGIERVTAAQWQATHGFYASNANPMLVEGIAPLIDRLRERGLIERWFFIKYWLEGPHVRLRVLPDTGGDPDGVRAEVDAGRTALLGRRHG